MARPHAPRGQGRQRVVDAALALFAEHGVGGTSLQMIADHLGVTKAAVYYQFHAKHDIVVAVIESAFEQMRGFLDAAEAAPTEPATATIALEGLVDLVIAHRQAMSAVTSDPEVSRVVESHPDFQTLSRRLGAALAGGPAALDVHRRVAVAVVGAGLAHAAADPLLRDVSDAALRVELLRVGHGVLGTPAPAAP